MGRRALASALALAASLAAVPSASAIDTVNTTNLREGVTVDGILEHERALQRIALANGGNRAATTAGYDASVDYVASRLRAAGYRVTLDEFDFPEWTLNGPSTLAEVTPTARTWVEDTDYIVSQFSGAGDLTASVVPTTDFVVPPPGGAGSSTSGCEPGDFPAATSGNVALMLRGTCPFVQKYANAKAAGAVAALIANDGFEGRTAPLFITSPVNIGIPTIMVSSQVGTELLADAQAGATVQVVVDATTTPNTEVNVVADSRAGARGRTIVVGAHLDSVEEGPGINDNGSGTSTILEIAEEVAQLGAQPAQPAAVRLLGRRGSRARRLDRLRRRPGRERGHRADRGEPQLRHGGVAELRALRLRRRLVGHRAARRRRPGRLGADRGAAHGLLPLAGAPDGSHGDTRALGLRAVHRQRVAAGGLFTGAEGIKTARQAAIYGGFAGLAYDPATTRRATRSSTSTTRRSTRCRTPRRTRAGRSPAREARSPRRPRRRAHGRTRRPAGAGSRSPSRGRSASADEHPARRGGGGMGSAPARRADTIHG